MPGMRRIRADRLACAKQGQHCIGHLLPRLVRIAGFRQRFRAAERAQLPIPQLVYLCAASMNDPRRSPAGQMQLPDPLGQPAAVSRHAEYLQGGRAAPCGDSQPQRHVRGQLRDERSQLVWMARSGQTLCVSRRAHDFGESSRCVRDDRLAEQHPFQRRHPEAFLHNAGYDQNIERRIGVADVGLEGQPAEPVRHAGGSRHADASLQIRRIDRIAGDREYRFGMAGSDMQSHRHEVVEAFVLIEMGSDEADQALIFGHIQLSPSLRPSGSPGPWLEIRPVDRRIEDGGLCEQARGMNRRQGRGGYSDQQVGMGFHQLLNAAGPCRRPHRLRQAPDDRHSQPRRRDGRQGMNAGVDPYRMRLYGDEKTVQRLHAGAVDASGNFLQDGRVGLIHGIVDRDSACDMHPDSGRSRPCRQDAFLGHGQNACSRSGQLCHREQQQLLGSCYRVRTAYMGEEQDGRVRNQFLHPLRSEAGASGRKHRRQHVVQPMRVGMLLHRPVHGAQRDVLPLLLVLEVIIDLLDQFLRRGIGRDFHSRRVEAGQVFPYVRQLQGAAGGYFERAGIGRNRRDHLAVAVERFVVMGTVHVDDDLRSVVRRRRLQRSHPVARPDAGGEELIIAQPLPPETGDDNIASGEVRSDLVEEVDALVISGTDEADFPAEGQIGIAGAEFIGIDAERKVMDVGASEPAVEFDAVFLQRKDEVVMRSELAGDVGIVGIIREPDGCPDAERPDGVDVLDRSLQAVQEDDRVGPQRFGLLNVILQRIAHAEPQRHGTERVGDGGVQGRIRISFCGSDKHDMKREYGRRIAYQGKAGLAFAEPAAVLMSRREACCPAPFQLRIRKHRGDGLQEALLACAGRRMLGCAPALAQGFNCQL
ncbi:hypothetical protein BN871_BT_00010 [Paenibacillus sp. P22]|nr:hypothetical protein BN871_BT_00010 [Paenibacillus sp. P22]